MLPLTALACLVSLIRKQCRVETGLLLAINLAWFILQQWLAPPRISYAASYQFLWKLIVLNARYYIHEIQWNYLVLGTVLSFLVRFGKQLGKGLSYRTFYWQSLFLILGCVFFIIYLPWGEHTRRYMVITDYLFALFTALELGHYLARITVKNTVALALAFGLAYFSSGTQDIARAVQSFYQPRDLKGTVYALKWFSQNAKPNAKVLVLELEQELLHSTLKYLQDFFGRSDITVYNFSPFAQEYQKAKMKIIPLAKIDQPLLDSVDYIFWDHRPDRPQLEQFHQYVMNQIVQSPYILRLHTIYNDTVTAKEGYTRGTIIWQMNQPPPAP